MWYLKPAYEISISSHAYCHNKRQFFWWDTCMSRVMSTNVGPTEYRHPYIFTYHMHILLWIRPSNGSGIWLKWNELIELNISLNNLTVLERFLLGLTLHPNRFCPWYLLSVSSHNACTSHTFRSFDAFHWCKIIVFLKRRLWNQNIPLTEVVC